jgi:dTDP-L-rhamnose 4-epimerase
MNGAVDRILITGGAGFIGSHLARELLEAGHRVRVLDRLDPQVHGVSGELPAHLPDDVELVQGDVRDRDAVRRALQGVSAVYHFASAVGVGQSMYEIAHYTSVNNLGTATLLEGLIEQPVERLVVASSMSIYGEGMYRVAERPEVLVTPPPRTEAQLASGQWEPTLDGERLAPVPTLESKVPAPTSVYALSKYDQEKMCLLVGGAYRIPTVALRFFNVYGPHQALSNPYTGVLAIFASRCLNGNPPLLFEDGRQRRDFVHVRDVARACRAALTTRGVGEAINIGSGQHRDVLAVARAMIDVLGLDLEPVVLGKYRAGDVRHCYADIERARQLLDFEPEVDFHDGVAELADWLDGAEAIDNVMHASAELERRGLTL